MTCLPIETTAKDQIGLAVVPPGLHVSMPGSRRLWVDSTDSANGKDAPNNGSFEKPYLTIKYALGWINEGDSVLVKENHTETISDLATKEPVQITKNYVSLIGLGQSRVAPGGFGMPRITISTSTNHTTLIELSGIGIRVHGFLFSWTGSLTSGKTGISIDVQSGSDGCLVTGCKFSSSSTDAPPEVVELSADDFTMAGNHVTSEPGGKSMIGLVLPKATIRRPRIQDNVIECSDAGTFETGNSNIVLDAIVSGNFVKSESTINDTGGKVAATSTGIFSGNQIAADHVAGSTANAFTNENMPMVENYATKDYTKSGVLAN